MNAPPSGDPPTSSATPPTGGKSPGKGGKSLEMMQKRLQMEQQQQVASQHAVQSQSPQPMGQQPAQQQHQVPPISRPKGKDFSAMASRMSQQPQQQPPSQPQQVTQDQQSQPQSSPHVVPGSYLDMQQRQHVILAQSSQIPQSSPPVQQQHHLTLQHQQTINRPKGKDFSAMASRMPQPAVQDTDRAAQMQAAARAAAGLPPLDQPTAGAVPSLPTARVSAPQPSRYPFPQQVPPGQQHQQLQQQQQPPQQQQQQPIPTQQHPSYSAPIPPSSGFPTAARVPSGVSAGSAAAPTVGRQRQTSSGTSRRNSIPRSKPTPTPTVEEGRLSHPIHSNPSASYMAPLVGDRIRDMVKTLDPNYTISAEAEEQLLHLADDFLDKVTKQSLRMASHRGSKALDVQDVQWVLAKQWGIVIPGLGPPILKKSLVTSSLLSPAAPPKTSGTKRPAPSNAVIGTISSDKSSKTSADGAQTNARS